MRGYERYGPLVGIIGSIVVGAASVISALAYTGAEGEPYSPLNHFVSELGEAGVSELAFIFNVGLIVGGLCFAFFMAALAAGRRSRLVQVGALAGVVGGIGGALVGVFPMNRVDLHLVATITFFIASTIAVGLASVYLWRWGHARFPRWLAALGFATVAVAILFLILAMPLIGEAQLWAPHERPAVWYLPVLEWSVVAAILIWTLATSLTWWRADRGRVD